MKFDVISKLHAKIISIEQAVQILDVSERTIFRYLAAFVQNGALFIKHGNSNKKPTNKSSSELKNKVMALVKEKYFDFNMTHCLEKLEKDENIIINRETFREWCHEAGMVKKAKKRKAKVRRARTRMAQEGLLLQMDGSPHRWFGGKESCLIGAIDDATGDVPYAEFFHSEDTLSCMKVLKNIIESKGLFHILYVDRAGIYGGPKRVQFSQVKRALRELNISIIFANSAEAKGRIERLWQTFQDRLIPEMRLRKIASYEAANAFLQSQFLPNEYGPAFRVVPRNLESAYRPLPIGINLQEIFCLKFRRQVNRDHTFSWQGELFKITSELKHSIVKQQIEIRIYLDQSMKIYFANQELVFEKHVLPMKESEAARVATIMSELHAIKVGKSTHIHYKDRYYSVDPKYIGHQVSVIEKSENLLIYYRGKLIETHPLLTGLAMRVSTMPIHRTPWESALKKGSVYRNAAGEIGPSVEDLIVIILNRGDGFINNKEIWPIINLNKEYSNIAINESCKLALELDITTYRGIRNILNLRYKKQRAG